MVFSLVLDGFEARQKESPVDSLLTASAGLGDSAKLHVAWGHGNGGFTSAPRSKQLIACMKLSENI